MKGLAQQPISAGYPEISAGDAKPRILTSVGSCVSIIVKRSRVSLRIFPNCGKATSRRRLAAGFIPEGIVKLAKHEAVASAGSSAEPGIITSMRDAADNLALLSLIRDLVEEATEAPAVRATDLAEEVEPDDIPYRPPEGARVEKGVANIGTETHRPLFRISGRTDTYISAYSRPSQTSEPVHPFSPDEEKAQSAISNRFLEDHGQLVRRRNTQSGVYANNPPLLAREGVLPLKDSQYSVEGTEVAKPVGGAGHGPNTDENELADYELNEPSRSDRDNERFFSGKSLSKHYPGENAPPPYPFGKTGSYKDQAALNPMLRRMDRTAAQQNEANHNFYNDVYEKLEPILSAAEKDVYDGLIARKTRQQITHETGLSAQQQRTIRERIVEKGKRLVAPKFEFNRHLGQFESSE
jgi:hypothetical protein